VASIKLLNAPISKTHPTLFKLITLLAVTNFAISVFLIFGDAQALINFNKFPEGGIFPPLWFYASMWTLAGFWLLYGLKGNGGYKWTRRGLTLSGMVGGFWAFGFWTSFVSGTILGVSAPLLWSMYSAFCVIMTGEPVINPLAAVVSNNLRGSESQVPEEQTKIDRERTARIKDHD